METPIIGDDGPKPPPNVPNTDRHRDHDNNKNHHHNHDAVNQYDDPTTFTTTTTTKSTTLNDSCAGGMEASPPPPYPLPPPPSQQQQQQDIDFDSFMSNAQVIPETTTTTTTTSTKNHPNDDLNDHSRNHLNSNNNHNNHDTNNNNSTIDDDIVENTTSTTTTTITTTPTVASSSSSPPPLPPRFVSPKDFELLKVIGMGAFGKVLQVRNKCTQHIYAMKIISKRLLYKKGTSVIDNVLVERNILQRISSHPFIVTMQCSFQTREKLFIIMDYLAGGELFLRLGREGIFLEKTAAFYLSEIILAIEHLHNHNILHRDLKPENILLSCDGHVCITDFGLAKDFTRESDITTTKTTSTTTTTQPPHTTPPRNDNDDNNNHNNNTNDDDDDDDQHRARTICGTGEYMAPEMIARQGYGRSADYWSLGCIAYEMLSGRPPFDSKQGAKILFLKIMTERIKMPSGSSAAACKLLKGLLNRNVSARLGAAKSTMFEVGGVAGLKKVDFFAMIDWDKLLLKQIDPPATFTVDHDGDVQYFHDEFTTMPLPRSVVDMSMEHYQAKRVESEAFRGFSFIHDDFVLPPRNDIEEKTYWESIEEDGESLSDCASSIMGGNNNEEQQSPTPSKRPPRKRKKKGANTATMNGEPSGSVVSTTTTPIGTANNTPLGSTANTPEPSECGDISDQLETLGINDNNVSPLVTNVIEAVINQSKLNIPPNTVSPPPIITNSSPSVRTPPTSKPMVQQEEEWCVATGSNKKDTSGRQKQRNNLKPHMNNNTNSTITNNSRTPWSTTTSHSTQPPAPPFPRGIASTTAMTYQKNMIPETSKRSETVSTASHQQHHKSSMTTKTTPINSRANGWNQLSSTSSTNSSTGGRLQRLSSPSSQPPSQLWRSGPTVGVSANKLAPLPPASPTDWRSSLPSRQNATVSTRPSSDWRNHSMTPNRIHVDPKQQQQQQQHTARPPTNQSSTIPPTSLSASTIWPSLTKGDASTKISSSSLNTNTNTSATNSATKAPIVSGVWAARGSTV
jgi:serine/threonine protein kinase